MFKKEPAVLIALAAAIVAGIAQVQQTAAVSGWWQAVSVGAPLAAGILTRFHVVPAEVVRDTVTRTGSVARKLADLAARVNVDLAERPREAG